MRQEDIDKLKTWKIGTRLRVTDDLGRTEPLMATVQSIAEDFRTFEVKYDGTGRVAKLSVNYIFHFEVITEG